jgi:hypothetical protein
VFQWILATRLSRISPLAPRQDLLVG